MFPPVNAGFIRSARAAVFRRGDLDDDHAPWDRFACPWKAGKLAKAIHVLQAREMEG